MSHIPERKEKDCLNCGTIVQGRYCQKCGQENVEPKETFWHMFTHFFYDITHFDSSFFHTVHHLIFKPGFLSKEYMLGRRKAYLHPIRMYVFTSAMFFLLFFSFFQPKESKKENPDDPIGQKKRTEMIMDLQDDLKKDTTDAEIKNNLIWLMDTTRVITNADASGMGGDFRIINVTGKEYKSFSEYDSVQRNLPEKERHGWFLRLMVKREIELNNKYKDDADGALHNFIENILHKLPYLLFISLPLFALLLKLVYIRRKQFFYADHGVFTIHLYVFTFLMFLLIFTVGKIQDATGRSLELVMTIISLLLYFYLYKAMRNFYGQRRAKTIVKFFLVSFFSLIMFLILLIVFLFFSVFTF